MEEKLHYHNSLQARTKCPDNSKKCPDRQPPPLGGCPVRLSERKNPDTLPRKAQDFREQVLAAIDFYTDKECLRNPKENKGKTAKKIRANYMPKSEIDTHAPSISLGYDSRRPKNHNRISHVLNSLQTHENVFVRVFVHNEGKNQ
jgi:hypothetical protein